MFVRPRLPASARAASTIPAAGSVYITDPVGPTMPEIVSDGSPLPPPISSTLWPVPIRASLTRPDVNGANICAISARCLSQCRAEVSHASSALFCSSGVILVRQPDATHSRRTVSASRILLRRHRSDLVGNQLPASRAFYPNMYAAVLATCLFAAVLTFDGYAAGRHRHVSVDPYLDVLVFAD